MTGRHFDVKKMSHLYCKGIVKNMCYGMFFRFKIDHWLLLKTLRTFVTEIERAMKIKVLQR